MSQSVRDLERVIRRLPMNRGQTTILKYLYEADEFVRRDELIDAVRWGDDASFTAVLAAFSNRVNATEGITGEPGYQAFIERIMLDGEEHFLLTAGGRAAIEATSELIATFEYPMEELLEGEHVPVEFEPASLAEELTEADDPDQFRWTPTTPEDRLLVGYWEQVGGTIITEVNIGDAGPSRWPEGSSFRRLDGVRFDSEYRNEITKPTVFSSAQIQDIVDDRHVEIIEVKQRLNRPVIGQAIAGRDMFERDYMPRTVEPVVVCGKGDPSLEWVCRRNRIRVEIVEPSSQG